jgi:hypothetical protein
MASDDRSIAGEAEDIEEPASSTLERPPPTTIRMWSGEAMSMAEARNIARNEDARLIFLAGMPDSGKTTLLAAFYEKFQQGPFAEQFFAGSRTLVRFEGICHYARLASGGDVASTERTRLRDEVELVHFRVENIADKARLNLLLTDISGEIFRQVRDSTDEARRLSVASLASRFALLLDAGRLGDHERRHTVLRDNRQILQSFIDSGTLSRTIHVDLLLSKADLLGASQDTDQWQFAKEVVDSIINEFSSRLPNIRAWTTAARPPAGYDEAVGIDELFSAWSKIERTQVRPTEEIYNVTRGADGYGGRLPWPTVIGWSP